MAIKKFFKIFELRHRHLGRLGGGGTFISSEMILTQPSFVPVDANTSRELCEQVIEHMGVPGVQYAILEVWEKETL